MTQPEAATIVGTPLRRQVDGVSDDLLTAGLGLAGLRGPVPAFADPRNPTAVEIRRRAIYMSWRGLADVTEAGGFGRLYGPAPEEKIAGVEYLFSLRAPGDTLTTGVLLQIPADFDPANPALLATASSGSRGTYGALPSVGEWGLRRGYAVVMTDKGTGTGVFDLDRSLGIRIDGTLTDDPKDPLLTWWPEKGPELEALRRERPHTMLFKHASSGHNVEASWGDFLLQAIVAAFELLNAEFGARLARRLAPDNTLVIAAGISNGGMTVLRALERDTAGWIDGAVVSEPNVMIPGLARDVVVAADGREFTGPGASLFDYGSLHYLLQPAAVLAETDATAPLGAALAAQRPHLEAWCEQLKGAGLLSANGTTALATEARERLLAAGILPGALRLGAFNLVATLWSAISITYAAAYARASAAELPFGVSFAATDAEGRPRSLTPEESACLFSDSNGVVPTAGINVVAPPAAGMPPRLANAGSVELAATLRSVFEGRWNARVGAEPAGFQQWVQRLAAGKREAMMTVNVGERPVILLHGRDDSLIPVNHASRAYYAAALRAGGERAELRYYEVVHGQHFDAFLYMPGFAEAYVPLQAQLQRALYLLQSRLSHRRPLPPSQVVRSSARGIVNGKVPELGVQHLGILRAQPGGNAIRFDGQRLRVPQ